MLDQPRQDFFARSGCVELACRSRRLRAGFAQGERVGTTSRVDCPVPSGHGQYNTCTEIPSCLRSALAIALVQGLRHFDNYPSKSYRSLGLGGASYKAMLLNLSDLKPIAL